ncbi:ABC-2 family transporter protein [Patescibacteria group bacterium]|nr:ABC-2 family transporter protein [Patescibacteria group bacterium]
MHKYFLVGKINLQRHFVYRLNFVLWRVRNLVLMVSLFVFWKAIFKGQDELLGYREAQILTYTLGIALIRSIVLASKSADLAGNIKSGAIASWFLKPVGIFKLWFSMDMADKILNIFFTIFELLLVVFIFKPELVFQTNLFYLASFGVLLCLAAALFFLLSLFFSASGFWLTDVWAPNFLFMVVLLQIAGGGFFPLDILPSLFLKIIKFTPFPYMLYYPMKVYLGQISKPEVITSLLISCFWVFGIYFLVKIIWKKGLENYDAPGS